MEYIIVKDGIIAEHCCGEVPKGAIACPKGFAGQVGDKVSDFKKDLSAYLKKKEKTQQEEQEEVKVKVNELSEEERKHYEELYQAQLYLAQTDWYVIRQSETGKPVPEDVSIKRNECRELLSKK